MDQYGISFPILLDLDGQVQNLYRQPMAFPSAAYPQDWIIDVNGNIAYVNNGFEVDSMQTTIENQLQ